MKKFFNWCCGYLPLIVYIALILLIIGCYILPFFIGVARLLWTFAFI